MNASIPEAAGLHRRVCLPLVLLLLAACAGQPPVSEEQRARRWLQHRQQLAGLEQWSLKGRISIRLEDEGWSASLHWKQDAARYRIRFIAPFGQGVYELRGDESAVRLRTADNRTLYARDARTLLQQNLGWQLPVNALVHWIRGLPAPGMPAEGMTLDEQGRVAALRQDGWQVRYDDYGRHAGYALPERVSIEGRDVRLRLVIHAWET